MARPLRIEYEGAVYHVTARGNERGKIFFNKKDYGKFKEYLTEAKEKYRFLLHAFEGRLRCQAYTFDKRRKTKVSGLHI